MVYRWPESLSGDPISVPVQVDGDPGHAGRHRAVPVPPDQPRQWQPQHLRQGLHQVASQHGDTGSMTMYYAIRSVVFLTFSFERAIGFYVLQV